MVVAAGSCRFSFSCCLGIGIELVIILLVHIGDVKGECGAVEKTHSNEGAMAQKVILGVRTRPNEFDRATLSW